MRSATALANHLAPDTVNRLERAAEIRHDDALILMQQNLRERRLCAVYLFGHAIEMCLAAAYFRASGFTATQVIDDDTRARHMKLARTTEWDDDDRLMNSDPHPLVGWARFLCWKRSAAKPTAQEMRRLKDAIMKADRAYKHWRPELRYKITEAKPEQVAELFKVSTWFLEQRGRL